jgi:hypothetical protein
LPPGVYDRTSRVIEAGGVDVDEEVVLVGLAAAPVITALVAVVGQAAPALPRRAYPALAVVLGVAWNSAAALALGEFTAVVPLAGVVVGLSASGLYSGVVKPAAEAVRRA